VEEKDDVECCEAEEELFARLYWKRLLPIAVRKMLDDFGLVGQHFVETPERVTKAFAELLEFTHDDVRLAELHELFTRRFSTNSSGMVIYRDLQASSVCPHHLLPVLYEVVIGYIPREFVLGASKFARAVRVIAAQPVTQEAFTDQVADEFFKALDARGVIVMVQGTHTCMCSRGAKTNSKMLTSSVRGIFAAEDTAKQEFFNVLRTMPGN